MLTLIQHDDFSLTSPPSSPVSVVINAEVPVAAKVTNILTDTGRSDLDGITKDNRLTIRGLAQPYAVVALLMDGSNLGSVIADRTGSWTFPVVNLFIEGSYGLILNSISATGIAGPTNGTPGAPAFQIIVDLTNPLGPVVAPVVISGINPLGLLPQGLDAQPNFTRVKTPTITGTVEANAIVEILNGGVVIGSGLANGAGNSPLPLGCLWPMGSRWSCFRQPMWRVISVLKPLTVLPFKPADMPRVPSSFRAFGWTPATVTRTALPTFPPPKSLVWPQRAL